MSGDADVAAIAAAYAVGMLRHQPFFSANEQAAFLALGAFLYLNTWRLDASQEEATQAMRMLASAELDEDGLANWIRQRL
jgi:death-on-curing protein